MQTFSKRLERLRLKKDLTWENMASLLDLSVSMLMQVRRGNRSLSPRATSRLEQAEREAGIAVGSPSSPGTATPAQAKAFQEPAAGESDPVLPRFSDRLQWLRKEHSNLTLKAFAQRLKTGAGYIHELETGKKGHPSDEFIGRMSGEFSVRKRWLMEGIGPPFLHVPKFYEFDKLAPSDVAFANQLAPHYSALSTKLLTSAIQELANLLPGLFEDEMDIFLENILAITGELMRRAKVRRGTEEARSKPKALPMVETIESACEGERALMLEDELAQAKKEIEDRGFVAVEPNLLQRRVEAGVPVGSLRVLLNRDEKGTPLDPPTVKELSENQRTVLELWAEYWEAKNRGEERPEPPPFSLDANALREDLKAYFHDPYQALHLRRERALAGARMVAKVEEPANIRRKPEARRPAPPMPAPGAHTLPPKAS